MIMATETKDHHFVVETSAAVSGKLQRLTVSSMGEAIRIAHIWNRLYIVEKLTGWLLQRAVAYRLSGVDSSMHKCYALLRSLQPYDKHSLYQVTDWVLKHEKELTELAPPLKSKHYKGYSNIVLPIIQFCAEMKGAKV